MVVSVGTPSVVSATTLVVSASSGAAPTSSSARLAQAAIDAAAASIKRYRIGVLLGAKDPARLRVSAAVVRVPRANQGKKGRAILSRVAAIYSDSFNPDRAWVTGQMRSGAAKAAGR